MRGIDEARKFYEKYGKPMLHEQFPDYEDKIAVGLAGHGSECFGFDDELSKDHDYEEGFCLWISRETDEKIGVPLGKAYRALKRECSAKHSAQGKSCTGVHITGDFYMQYLGSEGAPESWRQWLSLPEYALAEATNGQVWRDDEGLFSAVRSELLHGMPEDVRKKRIAARAVIMAQSGQYNYSRCLKHGEEGAAMLALNEFVNAACSMIYCLNRAYMPYYKWQFRAMDGLKILSELKPALEFLLLGENDPDGQKTKAGVIEDICAAVIKELKAQELSHGSWDYLEPHAYEIVKHIEDPEIRALHIMEG